MPRELTAKIQCAVQDCLNDCYYSSNPLVVVAQHVDRLRADPSWNDAAVDRVELVVHQMLGHLVSRSSSTTAKS